MQRDKLGAENVDLSPFVGQRYLVIESYKKDGTPVKTPVWFIERNGTLFVRTDKNTGKAKRIRRNSHVRIALCNIRGMLKGSWVDAEAEVVSAAEAEEAYSLLKKKYGLQYRTCKIHRKAARKREQGDSPGYQTLRAISSVASRLFYHRTGMMGRKLTEKCLPKFLVRQSRHQKLSENTRP